MIITSVWITPEKNTTLPPAGIKRFKFKLTTEREHHHHTFYQFVPSHKAKIQGYVCITSCPSAGRGGHLVVVGALEQRGVAGVHLERGVAGDVWRAASPCPGVGVKELTRIIGAVAQAGPVEAGVWLVDFLRCVTLHEQVDGHHACTLNREEKNIFSRKHQAITEYILRKWCLIMTNDLGKKVKWYLEKLYTKT